MAFPDQSPGGCDTGTLVASILLVEPSNRETTKVERRYLIIAVLLGLLANLGESGVPDLSVKARVRPLDHPKALVERLEKPRHA
jgi:hypothetical protein